MLNELIEAKSQVSKVQTDYAEIINETLDIFANTINKQPAIDAVPVVRCKDCKHWGTDWALGETEYVKCCEFGRYMVGLNGYCVYGERKEEKEND